jgi:hypothetical protein
MFCSSEHSFSREGGSPSSRRPALGRRRLRSQPMASGRGSRRRDGFPTGSPSASSTWGLSPPPSPGAPRGCPGGLSAGRSGSTWPFIRPWSTSRCERERRGRSCGRPGREEVLRFAPEGEVRSRTCPSPLPRRFAWDPSSPPPESAPGFFPSESSSPPPLSTFAPTSGWILSFPPPQNPPFLSGWETVGIFRPLRLPPGKARLRPPCGFLSPPIPSLWRSPGRRRPPSSATGRPPPRDGGWSSELSFFFP